MFDTPEWLGVTGFYDDDLRSPLGRRERKTWEPICVWATPYFAGSTMSLTFQASTVLMPPSDRQYLLELLSVPDGVTSPYPVGRIWELPLLGQHTLTLPTYRTTDGLTGYHFAFTITRVERQLADIDDDGDVDRDDFAVFERCFAGPDGEPGLPCRLTEFNRSDINGDGYVDLADFSLFTINFTDLLASRITYVGAAACTECHEVQRTSWTATRHATAFDTLIGEGEEENPVCLPCHTVGYGKAGGFVDVATTPELADVQCENCHGPGSHHAADADNVGIDVELNSSLCGQCHVSCHGLCGDYYQPHYEQWSTSMHSRALADVMLLPEYEDSCLQCHSTDYRLAREGEKPTASQVMYSLECVACHVPYGSANVYQLRLQPRLLCAECHTMGGVGPGETPATTQGTPTPPPADARKMHRSLGVSG